MDKRMVSIVVVVVAALLCNNGTHSAPITEDQEQCIKTMIGSMSKKPIPDGVLQMVEEYRPKYDRDPKTIPKVDVNMIEGCDQIAAQMNDVITKVDCAKKMFKYDNLRTLLEKSELFRKKFEASLVCSLELYAVVEMHDLGIFDLYHIKN